MFAITLQALANGLLSGNLHGDQNLLFSFTAFGFSALAFGFAARIRRTGPRARTFHGERLRLMMKLNVATAVTFLGFYWSLTLIPASLASAVETGIGPLALAVSGLRSSTGARQARKPVLGALALVLALGVAGRVMSLEQAAPLPAFCLGLAAAAVAGISAASIATLSHRLGRLEVPPVEVTAHRFHLTYVLALAALLFGPGPGVGHASGAHIGFIALVAVFGAALPLFVLQVGMQRTTPFVVTLLASAVPSLTYLMATFVGDEKFDLLTFVLINGSLAVAFLGPVALRHAAGAPGGPHPGRHGVSAQMEHHDGEEAREQKEIGCLVGARQAVGSGAEFERAGKGGGPCDHRERGHRLEDGVVEGGPGELHDDGGREQYAARGAGRPGLLPGLDPVIPEAVAAQDGGDDEVEDRQGRAGGGAEREKRDGDETPVAERGPGEPVHRPGGRREDDGKGQPVPEPGYFLLPRRPHGGNVRAEALDPDPAAARMS